MSMLRFLSVRHASSLRSLSSVDIQIALLARTSRAASTSSTTPATPLPIETKKQPLKLPKRLSIDAAQPAATTVKKKECGSHTPDEELDELEEMFIEGPAGVEWGGPTRGGQRPEPTRYGDWERNARVSDF